MSRDRLSGVAELVGSGRQCDRGYPTAGGSRTVGRVFLVWFWLPQNRAGGDEVDAPNGMLAQGGAQKSGSRLHHQARGDSKDPGLRWRANRPPRFAPTRYEDPDTDFAA